LADSPVRREVHYSGQVQGVGFRNTVRTIADRHGVTGYVVNLPDGRVKLVAEGTPKQLTEFLANVSNLMEQYIRDTYIENLPPTGEFFRFDIVF
jgi:acylphosphatase